MKRIALYFESPSRVSVHHEPASQPKPEQVLIKTEISAISQGTELLIFLGQFPEDLEIDENIKSYTGKLGYPLKYGYASVGWVVQIGKKVNPSWMGKRVFVFHPHESHFTASPDELILVPEALPNEDAVFLANMETAVNLVMDGKPVLGENVVVFGQGVVGLLTAALLSHFPLKNLITLDRFSFRREASQEFGVFNCFDPADPDVQNKLKQYLPVGADLVYELTGSPDVLNQALEITGFDGRLVVGSFYGKKSSSLNLGGWFHRSRVRLISSQVSTLASEFSGRWSKERRFEIAWDMIDKIKPSRLITQRYPILNADQAYNLLAEHPEKTIQVVLTY